MGRLVHLLGVLLLPGVFLLLGGCGCTVCDEGPVGRAPPADTAMADFALEDVNPNSLSYQTPVSPRTQVGHISAWYFGSAT